MSAVGLDNACTGFEVPITVQQPLRALEAPNFVNSVPVILGTCKVSQLGQPRQTHTTALPAMLVLPLASNCVPVF